MPRRIFLAVVLAGAAAVGIFAPNLANGLTTFNAGGCSSCHAVPGQPDRTRLGGGLAIPSPFGTFYAPNISPDPVDGIGRWTEAEFVRAVTKGISPAGVHYFPAFPYTSYQHARLEDIRDLFAYLRTLVPVSGKVRDHDVPFPFNIRVRPMPAGRLFDRGTMTAYEAPKIRMLRAMLSLPPKPLSRA